MGAFQTYDFTLAAGGAIQIPATGSFFRVQSATGKVNVTAEFGALKGLGVGQGARSPFRILQIQDASGSANVGTIIVGDAEFVDDRISGEVSVIDGEKARTIAGGMFAGGPFCGAVAAQYANVQLWNPNNSGKNLIVTAIDYGTVTTSSIGVFLTANVLATTFGSTASNKKAGGSAAIGILKYESKVAADIMALGVLRSDTTVASQNVIWNIKGAIVIPPNYGLNCYAPTPNTTINANYEWFEESQ